MRYKFVKSAACALVMVFTLSFAVVNTQAQKNDFNEARDDVKDATRVLNTFVQKPDNFIPRELLERAEGIAVFPGVIKAAFIVGGRGGDGVVARRTADGWSVPVFYNLGGASWGAQIGVESTDYVMLFMNEGALQALLNDKLEFGGELSFAAGPVGRTAAASTNATLKAGILTWSMSKGAFIGASLKGAYIKPDTDANRAIYGMDAKSILNNPAQAKKAGLPGEITAFTHAVASYAGSRRSAQR